MKAIVLCCDKYHMFAYHTILSYQKHWPNNKFTFYIPWCNSQPHFISNDPRIGNIKVKFIKCADSSFKTTVATLLSDIDDDEWVYWCSSDQYLTKINADIATQVEDMLTTPIFIDTKCFGVSSALLNKNGMKLIKHTSDAITISGKWGGNMIEKETWDSSRTITLWFHQYLRVKVIRHIFKAFDEPIVAKNLDKQLYSNVDKIYCLPKLGKYFTIDSKIATFAENTSRGKILINTVKSFKIYDIVPPSEFKLMEKELHWV